MTLLHPTAIKGPSRPPHHTLPSRRNIKQRQFAVQIKNGWFVILHHCACVCFNAQKEGCLLLLLLPNAAIGRINSLLPNAAIDRIISKEGESSHRRALSVALSPRHPLPSNTTVSAPNLATSTPNAQAPLPHALPKKHQAISLWPLNGWFVPAACGYASTRRRRLCGVATA